MRTRQYAAVLGTVLGLGLAAPGLAGASEYLLTIKDHRFEPAQLSVPAGAKVKLRIKNLDGTPEEFESYKLNREKVVPAGREVVVYIGPLEAGEYPFFGEFHEDSAQGVIVAE